MENISSDTKLFINKGSTRCEVSFDGFVDSENSAVSWVTEEVPNVAVRKEGMLSLLE